MKYNEIEVQSITFNGQEITHWLHNGVEVFTKYCNVTINIGSYVSSVKCEVTEYNGQTWDTTLTSTKTISVGYGATIKFTDTARASTNEYDYTCSASNPTSVVIQDNETFQFTATRSKREYWVVINYDDTVDTANVKVTGYSDASTIFDGWYWAYYGDSITITAPPANSVSHKETTITKKITADTTIDVSCNKRTYNLYVSGVISATKYPVQLQYSLNGRTHYETATSSSTGSVAFTIKANYGDIVILDKIFATDTYHTFNSPTYTITQDRSITF